MKSKVKTKSKIKIRVIKPERIEVFGPNGDSCGKLNELEFLDIRCQIKKHKESGFYVYHNAEKVEILPNGQLAKYLPIFEEAIYKRNYLLGINNNLYKDDTND